MNKLADRVALVTGGASGLGRALCEQLAADGAFALVADINTRKAEEVAVENEPIASGDAGEIGEAVPNIVELRPVSPDRSRAMAPSALGVVARPQ